MSNGEIVMSLAGHIGFAIDAPFRGRGLAARATRLLFSLARHHGLEPLWLTTTTANTASQRAIAKLGAEFVGAVPIPPDDPSYAEGEREKLRYRIRL